MTLSSADKAGGFVPQPAGTPAPEALKRHQLAAKAAAYREQAVADGIAFKEHGLFPPEDALLLELIGTPGLHPFEKHLAGGRGPYESLPLGGWTTGDAAAQNGLDLRLFYKDPAPGEQFGTIRGALRFGDRACIGNGLWTSVHGGAIESALDEATAELAKMAWTPMVSTVDISFKIRKPVPARTSLLVECRVKEQRGIRLWVEGTIKSADGALALATCEAVLADITQFL